MCSEACGSLFTTVCYGCTSTGIDTRLSSSPCSSQDCSEAKHEAKKSLLASLDLAPPPARVLAVHHGVMHGVDHALLPERTAFHPRLRSNCRSATSSRDLLEAVGRQVCRSAGCARRRRRHWPRRSAGRPPRRGEFVSPPPSGGSVAPSKDSEGALLALHREPSLPSGPGSRWSWRGWKTRWARSDERSMKSSRSSIPVCVKSSATRAVSRLTSPAPRQALATRRRFELTETRRVRRAETGGTKIAPIVLVQLVDASGATAQPSRVARRTSLANLSSTRLCVGA